MAASHAPRSSNNEYATGVSISVSNSDSDCPPIKDALQLGDADVAGGRVQLYQAKTGHPVYAPLPPFVVEALLATPARGRAIWWDGAADLDCTADIWRRRLKIVGEIAGVADVEFHRFRHTFAVELLMSGVSIDRVSVLMGHRSVKVTE